MFYISLGKCQFQCGERQKNDKNTCVWKQLFIGVLLIASSYCISLWQCSSFKKTAKTTICMCPITTSFWHIYWIVYSAIKCQPATFWQTLETLFRKILNFSLIAKVYSCEIFKAMSFFLRRIHTVKEYENIVASQSTVCQHLNGEYE